jgi:hypothetical protein
MHDDHCIEVGLVFRGTIDSAVRLQSVWSWFVQHFSCRKSVFCYWAAMAPDETSLYYSTYSEKTFLPSLAYCFLLFSMFQNVVQL